MTGGTTNNLGNVTWTPTRVGPTVFEIGYPDRTSGKFRHGDDWFVGDIGPSPTAPSPIWTKFLDYPFDFPNGVNYVVGQSRWGTDWNFIQPEVINQAGNFGASSSTISFNLATAPASGATASLYLALRRGLFRANHCQRQRQQPRQRNRQRLRGDGNASDSADFKRVQPRHEPE